jgi:beta-lactamase regulating signal transducer with metallopeptidase domain
MTSFAGWISPEVLRALSWTLLHFVWQGAGLAALFAVAMAVCRSAQMRYAVAVTALGLMMASPVITFTWLHREAVPAVQSGEHGALTWAETSTQNATALSSSVVPAAGSRTSPPTAMLWLVEAWFLGVVLLSLRTAGGLLLIARMRRKEIKPVASELHEKCLALQKKMGLDRLIRYCECHRLDAPAVLGWFRPVVLLPVRALTGLTAEQIQVVIAHELAHIRRLDSFVNLFQIAMETVLFYHPAVWWVSQRIRVEREVCCDDEALAICGDAVNYARALTLMEEWRTAPSLLMAANRGPLTERILRLLGLNGASSRTRVAGLGVSLVCLATALLAGHAFLGVAHAALDKGLFSKQEPSGDSVIIVKPAGIATGTEAPKPSDTDEQTAAKAKSEKDKDKDKDKEKDQHAAGDENKKESYLDAIEAAGFKNLDVDEIIAMKVQGITPEYIKGIRELGLQPSADELVGMKVQGITADYIREMRTFHSNLTVDELIGMKVQGVTPQYVREFRDLGLQPDPDETVGMKVQGVTPEYVRELRATGLQPGIDELIGMKVQGITPEYVKAMQAAGFKDLDCDELIGAKVQGITPEFIEKARKHGFQNLTLDKLMALKHADIL